MSAFDDYLQLLNNNPKMDATKQWANKLGNNVKTGIEDSLPKGTSPTAMLDYASNVNPIAGLAGNILAWHASPHKFSKFENKAIGTGEGVQAFGMGHYSGENVNALDAQYRKYLSQLKNNNPSSALDTFKKVHKPELDSLYNRMLEEAYSLYPKDLNNPHFIDSNPYTALHGSDQLVKKIFESAQNAKRGIIDKSWQSGAPRGISEGLGAGMGNDLYEKALTYKIPKANDKGYLYQLNLKPNKEDLLQYNKAIPHHSTDFLDKYVAGMNDLGLGQDAFTAIKSNLKGRDAYKNLTKITGSDTATSQLLNSWGIPGHAFVGQGGKGLDNYVMYNPENIQIIRRISSGLDNPIESFRNYPVDVHRAVDNLKLNPADAQPKGLLQKIQELSNNNLRDIEW